jgi:hypothetical protein
MKAPMRIKRQDVADDIRTLASLTGLDMTEAVGVAVRAQIAIERANSTVKQSERQVRSDRILAELRRLPVVGPVITDEDLYDSEGLPK